MAYLRMIRSSCESSLSNRTELTVVLWCESILDVCDAHLVFSLLLSSSTVIEQTNESSGNFVPVNSKQHRSKTLDLHRSVIGRSTQRWCDSLTGRFDSDYWFAVHPSSNRFSPMDTSVLDISDGSPVDGSCWRDSSVRLARWPITSSRVDIEWRIEMNVPHPVGNHC